MDAIRGLSAAKATTANSGQTNNPEKKQKLVIVGGVAGGATAAARASRVSKDLDITIVERSPDVSFANCGLPYYLGREITDRSLLALQTPESLSKAVDAKVLTSTEALQIDRSAKTVTIRSVADGKASTITYDKLILSPGASPIRPKVPGIDDPRVHTLRNLVDLDRIDALLSSPSCKRVAVIGAGFIGLELVEQLHHLGKTVSLVERGAAVLPQADQEMASFLHVPLIEQGVDLHLGDGLASFHGRDELTVTLASGARIQADLALLCVGVAPDSSLARDAGLKLSARGHIVVNEYMQTSDKDIYAVGDAIETADLVFPERRASVALGNIANMQARIAADHIARNSSIPYRGSLGTSIVRVFEQTLALTGWTESRLRQAGIAYATTTITANAHASYYPGALPITMKITFDPDTRRIFGAQAVGPDGADKRIDVVATAITGGLTVDDLSLTQLCYSPPYGSARDVANIAGLAARNISEGLVTAAYALPKPNTPGVQVLDVRPRENASLNPVPGSINIPWAELKSRVHELSPEVHYVVLCALGKTAYFASRVLALNGKKASPLIGGARVHNRPTPKPLPKQPIEKAVSNASSASTTMSLDCSGLACPGPLLKLKEAVSSLPANSVLEVKATDPGFKSDVAAFASSQGLEITHLSSDKGIIRASLRKPADNSKASSSSSSASPAVGGVRQGATIVVFSQELDKVLAALVIANGAAAMATSTASPPTLFFTFWGLNALRHPDRRSSSSKSLIDKAFELMMPRGQSRLPISNMNFAGAGALLLKHVMKEKELPNVPGLLASARAQGVRLVACTMSMEAMGITKEELIDGVELGGVADFLHASEKSGTNLFI